MTQSLNTTLNIALRGIQSNQTALATAAHNISNVNSDGYVRQIVRFESDSINGFGAGVQITDIQRNVDALMVQRTQDQTSVVGYETTRNEYLKNIESLFGFGNSDTSLEKMVTNMFNQMNNLANSPDSSAQRLNVIQSIDFVTSTLSETSEKLSATATRADNQIDDEIDVINSALENIYRLNVDISSLTVEGDGARSANDLIDERERQINLLAERIGVNVSNDSNGTLRVTTESGRRLVDASGYTQMERGGTMGSYQGVRVRSVLSSGQMAASALEIDFDDISSGSLNALVDTRDTTIPNLQAELDVLAANIITEMNRLHSQGSAYPPVSSYTLGNSSNIALPGDDLYDTSVLGLTAGDSFELSVVDKSDGTAVATTLDTGGTTPGGTLSIDLPGAGPFTLGDLATLINTNPDVGALVTATVGLDADGNSNITITANDTTNHALVFSNKTGDPLGDMGINNLLVGTSAEDIDIRSDIEADPSLLATAQMRTSDGGVSAFDNRNIISIANMAEQSYSFAAAGELSASTASFAGYASEIVSNLAINLDDARERQQFAEAVLNDISERSASISGVNLDEELSNILVYQNAYQASARIAQLVDELYDALMQIGR